MKTTRNNNEESEMTYDPDNDAKVEKMTDQQLDDELTDAELYMGEMESQFKAAKRRISLIIEEMDYRELRRSKMENMPRL
jgi:hypothetical protein